MRNKREERKDERMIKGNLRRRDSDKNKVRMEGT